MNKAIIVACMGLLVVAGCSKDKKPSNTDASLTPPSSPAVAPVEPLTPAIAPVTPVAPAPAPAPLPPEKPVVTKSAPAPRASHVTAAASASKKVYVVKKGDNLTKIAKAHKTTVSKILKVNPKLNPNKIVVGQKITLP